MSQPFIDELEGLLVFEDLEQLHGMPPTGIKATHPSHYALHGLGVLVEAPWPPGIPEPWLLLFSGCCGPRKLCSQTCPQSGHCESPAWASGSKEEPSAPDTHLAN